MQRPKGCLLVLSNPDRLLVAKMLDQVAERVVGRPRFTAAIQQSHRTTVTISPFKPLNVCDPLGDSHGVGFDQTIRLNLLTFARINTKLGEDNRTLTLAGFSAASILRTTARCSCKPLRGHDCSQHRRALHKDAGRCNRNDLRACANHLLKVIRVDRFGRQSHLECRINLLGRNVSGRHQFGIVSRCLIGPTKFGGSFQTSRWRALPRTCSHSLLI